MGLRLRHMLSTRSVVRLVALPTLTAAAISVAPPVTATTTRTDLGVGSADAINDSGQVAGHFTNRAGLGRAFLWTSGRGRRDIGGLGGNYLSVTALNSRGLVAGYAATPGGAYHAFRWTPARGMQDLGTLGGSDSFANAMNSSGTVVGTSVDATGERHAFAWSPGDRMRDLGAGIAQANDINDRGQVVGSFLAEPDYPSASHLFLWSRSAGLRDLGRPDVPIEGHFSLGALVNERGEVAGTYTPSLDTYGAFRWAQPQGFQLLAPLPDNYNGRATSINDAGMVAGIYTQAGLIHAFRWSPATGLRDLGVVSNDWHESGVWFLNARGDVAGTMFTGGASHRLRAVRWTAAGGMQQLGTLGGDLSAATAINAKGQVVGWSNRSDGQARATRWMP